MKLYDRYYELIIADTKTQKTWTINEGLQVIFKIEKFGDITANKAEIKITNLNKSERDFIDREDLEVIFKAGYKNSYGQIFKGQTTFLNHSKGDIKGDVTISNSEGFEHRQKDDMDWKSTIKAKDSLKALRDFYISESLKGDNLTEKQVIDKLIKKIDKEYKIPKGVIKGLKDKKINNGIALSGSFQNILNQLCRKRQLKPMVTDGIINIIPINSSLNTEAIILDSTSGLIKTPERIENGGYKLFSLLRHEFQPGSLIKVVDNMVNGYFIIENLVHSGDSDGTDWYSELEVFIQK